jgi:hypothetical protein
MTRSTNIFFKLVKDENSATELLCNLMRFTPFRCALLARLFPGSGVVNQIEHEGINTQIALSGGNGRPDVVIEGDKILAIVEVKVELNCVPTENQPDGYFKYLLEQRGECAERWLAFLVPKGWIHEQSIKDKFTRFKADSTYNCIKTSILYW